MMKQLLCLLALALCRPVFAQDAPRVWTLKECIDYALQNNIDVRRSLLGMETADINLLQSKAQMLPTLNAGSSPGINLGRSIDPTTNLFLQRQINSINFNANSNFLLFNGLRLLNTVRQNQIENKAAMEDYQRAKNDVILSVISFYMNVIFNKELYQNAEIQLNTTNQQLARTRRLAEAGSVPRGDVLDLEAQAATNELNLVTRENALNLSLLQLKQALQLPGATAMDVEVPAVDMVEELMLNEDAEDIYMVARTVMPEIKAASYRVESTTMAVRAARGNYFPRVNLNGNVFTNYSSAFMQPIGSEIIAPPPQIGVVQGTNQQVISNRAIERPILVTKPFNDQFSENISKVFSLQIQIPIFNGLNTRAGVQRSIISNQQAVINLQDNENRLRQAVETAYNDAAAAAKTYQSSLRQVAARDEAFRMNKQRFESGGVDFVNYQVAENNLFQAQSDLLRAKYDFIFRKKVLDFYLGKPLEF
jgi:outer membrane protein